MYAHEPVLLDETLEGLAVSPDGTYVDATFGRGGHARSILAQLGADGRLLAMDRDPAAIAAASDLRNDPRVTVVRAAFEDLDEVLRGAGLGGLVNGILLDLGVSSPQLDDPDRGFSFQNDGPLDMRMDPDHGYSAADWLARASEREIGTVLRQFGEERHARRIARAIVRAREDAPIETTGQLAALIAEASPSRERSKHPATRSFQAIRIFINRELEQLENVLPRCIDHLVVGGRLCVIAFHSLEDRIVKRFMRDNSRVDPVYAGLPDIPAHALPTLTLVGKRRRAGDAEVARNPRARSAVLRVAERVR